MNPPITEEVCVRNSYPFNLPPALEAAVVGGAPMPLFMRCLLPMCQLIQLFPGRCADVG